VGAQGYKSLKAQLVCGWYGVNALSCSPYGVIQLFSGKLPQAAKNIEFSISGHRFYSKYTIINGH